ncbi:MAG TPA: hypothetical protein VK779_09615 [Rhizomicrobium sp.]|jgi:hypothetical protein|nr:hypothetical protein [Rhizomicrobium sp.]
MRGRPSGSGIAAAAIILSGFAATVALTWPGYVSYDSALQLLQGRVAHYNTWHPPVMAWMLGVMDAVVPGAGLFVLFDAALLYAAMLALLWLRPKPSWAAPIVALICALSPQFLIYQGNVWKDVLFADAAVAGFASLACAAAYWEHARTRFVSLIIAFALFVLAALARQNGIIVLGVGAVALTIIARGQLTWRDSIPYRAGVLIASILALAGANTALETRGDNGYGRLSQVKALQLYDITGMVAAAPGIKLDWLHKNSPALEELIRSDGVRLYSPVHYDTLAASDLLQKLLVVTPEMRMMHQWLELIVSHPLLYLRVREEIFRWVTLTPDIAQCHPYYVGVSGPPDAMRQLNLNTAPRLQDRMLWNYGARFVGTPVYSHALFGVISLVATIVLFRRRAPADLAMAFMLVSALVFALSFFVISVACDYRYLYYVDLSALVACFYLAASVPAFPYAAPRE